MHSHVLRCWIWIKGLCLPSVFSALSSFQMTLQKSLKSHSDNSTKTFQMSAQKYLIQMLTRHTYLISIIFTDLQIMSSYFWKMYSLQVQIWALASYYFNTIILSKGFWKDCTEWNLWFYILLQKYFSFPLGWFKFFLSISLFSPAERPSRRLSSKLSTLVSA